MRCFIRHVSTERMKYNKKTATLSLTNVSHSNRHTQLMPIEKNSHSHLLESKESSSTLQTLTHTHTHAVLSTQVYAKNRINHCTGTQFNGSPNSPSSILRCISGSALNCAVSTENTRSPITFSTEMAVVFDFFLVWMKANHTLTHSSIHLKVAKIGLLTLPILCRSKSISLLNGFTSLFFVVQLTLERHTTHHVRIYNNIIKWHSFVSH